MNRIKYVFLLSTYLKGYRMKMVLALIVHFLYKALPIALGLTTSYVFSQALVGRLAEPWKPMLTVLGMIVGMAVLNYLDILISHDVAYRVLTHLRNLSYEKLAEIAPAGLESESSGNIMSVMLEDIGLLEWFYAHVTVQIFVAVTLPIASLILLAHFSIWISLLLLVFIGIMIAIPVVYSKKSNEQGQAVRAEFGKLNVDIIDGIQGIKDIISFQWQGPYMKKLLHQNDRFNEIHYRYAGRMTEENRLVGLMMGLSSLAASVMILHFYQRGYYGVEWILPLISCAALIYGPLQETLSMSANYGVIFAASERVFRFLHEVPLVPDHGKTENFSHARDGIAFDNVSFSFTDDAGNRNNILKGLSFQVRQDETVVLVGSSGSGKSTSIKLLQRFWDVDSGAISIYGTDIREIPLKRLRDEMIVVPQETYLFNQTVEENLRFANRNASAEEMEAALKKANAYDFVMNLKEGLKTRVGERGLKLSGGEKQRLSIARGFLRPGKILLLDEITANLDGVNEKWVNEALTELKKGKYTLMIAHRLSTIQSADRIVFIKDGVCAATGTYEELIGSNEDFRNTVGAVSK